MTDDVEAQQEFDDFFEEVFTELEDKVFPVMSVCFQVLELLPCECAECVHISRVSDQNGMSQLYIIADIPFWLETLNMFFCMHVYVYT